MGDFGGEGEPPFTSYDQIAVAKAAGKVAENFHADFVVELGDNFYEHGVKHVKDKRFKVRTNPASVHMAQAQVLIKKVMHVWFVYTHS